MPLYLTSADRYGGCFYEKATPLRNALRGLLFKHKSLLCNDDICRVQSALNITVVASIPLVRGSSHPLSQSSLITAEVSGSISPGATFSA